MPQHRQEHTVQRFLYWKSLFSVPLNSDSSVTHIASAEIAQKGIMHVHQLQH